MAPANSRGYAGFWLRVAAYFVDSIIIAPIFLIVFGVAVFVIAAAGGTARLQGGNPDEIAGMLAAIGPLVFVGIWGVLIVPMWLYWAYMESSRHQGTLGKLAVGLKVTDLNGNPISFGRASGRFFAKVVSGIIPFGIAYIMAGFTQRKQALHDIIASCLVLRK